MCGICGFAGPGDEAHLLAMNEALAHRGPDGRGTYPYAPHGLLMAHRRLAILDLADGAQPMRTADGALCVTYNGEIYNHAELRRELESLGHVFATRHSDTEVLLHGYRQWGRELPARLNGMWAFAIHDRDRRQLFLSRDRFGKKPLYYHHRPGFFAFASEVTALLAHPGIPRDISALGLQKYLAYGFTPAPLTLYQGVRKLPGGKNLLLDLEDCSLREDAYWSFRIEADPHPGPEAVSAWSEELRELLDKAVQRRLMADVPLGIFLSGGIDSTAVTALAARTVNGLRTFSVGFSNASFDESTYSLRAAKLFGSIHSQQTLALDSVLEDLAGRLDDPLGDSSIIPTFLLCRETRKHVTVALGGDGADELFAGYATFRALRAAKAYHALCPRPVHAAIAAVAARLPVSHSYMALSFKANRFLGAMSSPQCIWNPVWLGPAGPARINSLFGGKNDPEELYSEAIDAWEESPAKSLEDKTLEFYTRFYLQECVLPKVDRASMLNSLEVRAPFLDIEIADLARRIPYDFKFRHGSGKFILKKALEPLLPPDVLHRKKQGFAAPVGQWFYTGRLRLDPASLPALLNARCVKALEEEHRKGLADHRLLLWNLWILGRHLSHGGHPAAHGAPA